MPNETARTPILVALCSPIWGTTGDEPPSHPPIDVWREWRRVRDLVQSLPGQGMGPRPAWRVTRLHPPTLARLRETLAPSQSQPGLGLLHLSGTVGLDDGLLRMEQSNGREQRVTPRQLAEACAGRSIAIGLLTICHGAEFARELVKRAGVGAVVSTKYQLSDPEAALVARLIYFGLAQGLTLGEAFRRTQDEVARAYRESALPPIHEGQLGLSLAEYGRQRAVNLLCVGQKDVRLPPPEASSPGPLFDLAEPAHNLPHLYDVAAGRGQELVCLDDWLDEQTYRLIAITGVGGCGKSSLALRAALRASWRFQAVIHFNAKRNEQPAAPAFSAFCRLVETALALGTRLTALPDVELQFHKLLALLNSRPCLLVLDNVELLPQVELERFAHLARHLDPRNGSMLLVTCRPEHLPPLLDGTKGGFYHLAQQRLSELDALTLLSGLLRLPVERDATAAEFAVWTKVPAQEPSAAAADLEKLAELAEVPLERLAALQELAAAAHHHLFLLRFAAAQLREPDGTWDQVLARLRSLAGRDLEERVEAMVGRMFDDLERRCPPAQRVARTLLVFHNGATAEALQSVCCGRTLDPEHPDAIAHADQRLALRRATLLEYDPESKRYDLHPLVRHYLRTRRPPDTTAAALAGEAHAAYFARLAQHNRGQFELLEDEHANLRAALETIAQAGDERRLIDLAEDLYPFLWVRGHWPECRRLVTDAIAASRKLGKPPSEALLRGLAIVGTTDADDESTTAPLPG